MATMNLVFGGGLTKIGSVPLDILLTEDTQLPSTVTSYPVEEGAPISDHIIQQPKTVTITGAISSAKIIQFELDGQSRLVAAKQQLEELYEASEPVTVITGMDVYTNMGIENLSIRRDNTGVRYDIEATLKKIRQVELERTQVPQELVQQERDASGDPQGKGTGANGKVGETVDGGKVTPRMVTSELQEQLNNVFEGLVGQ